MWLGEVPAELPEVKAQLQTFDDGGAWDMAPQQPPQKIGTDRSADKA